MGKTFDYRSEKRKLEEIVVIMQSGELTIDESLAKYQEAEEIIKSLEKYLKTAENKITKIRASGK